MAQLLRKFEHWMQSSVSTVPLGSVTFSDKEQNSIRIGLSTLSVAWALTNVALGTSVFPHTLVPALVATAYLLGSFCLHYAWRNLYSLVPLPMHRIFVLRVVCLTADVSAISLFVAHSGAASIPLMPVYLSAIIGYGMRFGRTYTFLCLCVSEITFLSAALNNEWLLSNAVVVGSQCITMAVLPFYVIGLLQRYSVVLEAHVHSLGETKDYLSLVSHEIRAPLQGIVSIVEDVSSSISSNRVSADATSLIPSLQGIRSCAERVLDIANRVSAQQARAIGTLPKRTCTLFSPVFDTSRSIAICAAAATGSSASLTWRVESDVPATLPIEASLAHDILINLLDNAYKASPNGQIDVAVSIDRRGDNSNLVISVSDSGHSSPCESPRPAPTPTINSNMRPSRGLGLTIVRADLRSVSGQLEFSLQPNGGSRSVVSIPIRDSAPASASARGVSLLLLFSSISLSSERIKNLVEVGIFPLVCRVSRMMSVNGTLVDLPLVAAYCDESPDTLFDLRRIAGNSSGTTRPFIGIQERLSATREALHFNYVLDFSSNSIANQARALSPFRRQTAQNSLSSSVDRLSILLCEDSSIVAAALRSSFLQSGHRCDIATTESQALQSLRRSSYDLVITDRFLGEVDIFDSFLSRELAASQQLSILLTADASSTASRSLGSSHFFRILVKPVTAKELLSHVSVAVKTYGPQESVDGEDNQTQSSNGHRASEPSIRHEPLDFLSNENLAAALKVEALVDLALCLNHLSFGQRKLAKLSLHRLIGALQYLGATSAEDSARRIGEDLIDSDSTSPGAIEPFADMAEQIAGLFEGGRDEIHHGDVKLQS